MRAVMQNTQPTLRELNDLRVLVIHPHDGEAQLLVAHLRRIGCRPTHQWPMPVRLGTDTDVVLLTIEEGHRDAILTLATGFDEWGPPVIGIVEYENPATLQLILQSGCAGVIERPVRPFGLLTQLLLARTAWKQRLARLAALDALRADAHTSLLTTAKTLLMTREGMTENEAHRSIQARAMHARASLHDMARIVIDEMT